MPLRARGGPPPAGPTRVHTKYHGGWEAIPAFTPRPVIIEIYDDHWKLLRGGGGRQAELGVIALSDVVNAELVPMTADHARGWNLATGIIGSGQRISGTSALRLRLADGGYPVFELTGPHPVLEAQWANFLDRFRATPSGGRWAPDPTGRHEQRYWDGAAWTEHVSDGGAPAVDPV